MNILTFIYGRWLKEGFDLERSILEQFMNVFCFEIYSVPSRNYNTSKFAIKNTDLSPKIGSRGQVYLDQTDPMLAKWFSSKNNILKYAKHISLLFQCFAT